MHLPAAAGPWRPFICSEQPGSDPGPASRLLTNRKLAHWDGHQRKAFRAHTGACCVRSEWPVSMATPPCIHLQPPALKRPPTRSAEGGVGRRFRRFRAKETHWGPGDGGEATVRWPEGANPERGRQLQSFCYRARGCKCQQNVTDATDGCGCLSGFAFTSQTAEWKSG